MSLFEICLRHSQHWDTSSTQGDASERFPVIFISPVCCHISGVYELVSVPDADRTSECIPLGDQRPDGGLGVHEESHSFLPAR